MMSLMEELTSTGQTKFSFARQAYNDAVMTYNTRREVFRVMSSRPHSNFAPAELS